MTMGLTGAGLAAALAAVGEGAAIAAPAVAGAGATAATVAPAVGGALAAAPVLAEGAMSAAPALEAAAPGTFNLGAVPGAQPGTYSMPEFVNMTAPVEPTGVPVANATPPMGMDEALGPLQATMQGDIGGMIKPPDDVMAPIQATMQGDIDGMVKPPDVPGLGNPMDILGGETMPAPVDTTPAAPVTPAKPYVPTQQRMSQASGGDWRGKLKTAQQALGMGQMLMTNPKDKQTMALLQMSAGMGAADSPESTMEAMKGPLAVLAEANAPKEPKMSEAMASPLAPQQAQPVTPATKAPLPATSVGGASGLTLQDRLRVLRGY